MRPLWTILIALFSLSLYAQDVPHAVSVINLTAENSGNGNTGIEDFTEIDGRLLVRISTGDLHTIDLLVTLDGQQIDTLTTQGEVRIPLREDFIGRIDDRLFYSSPEHQQIIEVDLGLRLIRERIDLYPDATSDRISNTVMVDETLYYLNAFRTSTPQVSINELLAVDPSSGEATILHLDTVANAAGLVPAYLLVADEQIYFPDRKDTLIQAARYDVAMNTITSIGPSVAGEYLSYTNWNDIVYVRYPPAFTRADTFSGWYPIINDTLGNRITADPWEQLANFPDKLIAAIDELLYAIDKASGDSTVLMSGAGEIRNLTPINDEEAIFLRQNEGSIRYAIWRTDGSRTGTRKMMDVPTSWNTEPYSTAVLGHYLVLNVALASRSYVIDFNQEYIERAGFRALVEADRLLVIDDALFLYGSDPAMGREIHRITIADPLYLEGRVFYDANSNGLQEETEDGIAGAILEVTGGNNRRLYSQEDGTYRLPVKDGETYTLTINNPDCCVAMTTPDSYTFAFAIDSTYQLNFGYAQVAGPSSLRPLLNSGTIRCGFEHDFWLSIINDGCQPLAGEGRVHFPEEMEFLNSDVVPLSQEENTLTFAFDTLQPNASQRFRIRFRMPDENFAGLPVELGAVAGAVDGQGAMITSDTFAYREILRCAIDPNDKQVSPSRPEPSMSNYTQLDETLRYTIRFQNTGNDTAFTVRIQDQISESLNLETFKPLAASHPYSVSVREDRTLIFLFEDILLPDSTTNLPGSQGFVTFEIQPFPDLDDFSTIDNTAGIYFDFNQPVITNTVTSTLVEFLDEDQDGFLFYEDCNDQNFNINPAAEEIPGNGIDENCDDSDFHVSTSSQLPGTLNYFPNPTSGTFYLNYSENDRLNGELYSAAGQRLQTFVFQNSHSLDLEGLPAGLYLLRLYSREGRGRTVRVVRR
ncbi:DUF7619 domain-containing protein [Neolewinella agarilytica]|uniref:Conserved repeat domain-containing protein/Por secretion system C-terminal sorting domain-containing protein n=1 Tax=Neolewinella agarilytica TaxID=478744 RepID=A0A1H9HBJ6_9BACT|nr:T9SS type A sorting domain-containing protein [Neolewinella agarilytica]SEQ59710.1 conserved repeat domain-containing protein/Por secretion system C-terminal sorting domain-containing protein [Neolewinella agarilytica]